MTESNADQRIATHNVTTTVTADSRLIANTRHALRLEELGYRPKLYVPLSDIAAGTLVDSDTRTHCPYKGEARYYHVTLDGHTFTDAAWAYDQPLPGLALIAGLVAFDHPAIRVDQRG